MTMRAKANPPEGYVDLHETFGPGWRTAENTARALGFEVIPHPTGSEVYESVPAEAVPAIRAAWARSAAEYAAARAVGDDQVSSRVLDHLFRVSSVHFATQLGLPMTRPSAENEHFIRVADVDAIVAEARRVRGEETFTTPARVEKALVLIEEHGLRAKPWAVVSRERRLPGA